MTILSRIILTCLLLCSNALAFYSVGTRSISLLETDGSQFQMSVYYPALANGEKAAPVTNTGTFPTIVFIHGLMVDRTSFSLLASGFVQNGFVVFVPDLPGGVLCPPKANPSHWSDDWRMQLWAGVSRVI